jgi:hypothetical protein
MTRKGSSTGTNYASITYSQQYQVLLHSSIPISVPSATRSGFEKNLRHFANQSLWSLLEFDGDNSWILKGMLSRSLVIIHDGSYMKEILPTISSAATMIYCTVTRARCKCTWADQSDSAGSYRGKILGGIMTQLLLRAAADGHQGKIPSVGADCDNNGVVTSETVLCPIYGVLIYHIFMPVRLGDISNSIVDTHLKFVHVYQKKLGKIYTYFFLKCQL